ncbi:hypothetical protein ES708_23790 [subsurface metagenome]
MTVKDYPDWTDSIQVIGADIMLPIDLQAAYIMMPIDIQAQYINLAIDIVAQTIGNIAIDLAAQSVGDITVDIKAQTIGNLVIDIEAQSVGIVLNPEWEVTLGHGKAVRGWVSDIDFNEHGTAIEYLVNTGHTLYIYGLQSSARANLETDADKLHTYHIDITLGGIGTVFLGAQVGIIWTLAAPMKITTGNYVTFEAWSYAGHSINIYCSFLGFEV